MTPLARLAAALLLAGLASPAAAKVTRLEITTKQPYGSFRAGDYQRWDGRIHGELPPDAGTIPDLEKATRNTRGMVEYAARIILFLPTDPARGNGALLLDVPNRGKPYANALYNSPRGLPSQSGNLEPGTGFLEDQGFAIAEVHWELGQGAELPAFTDAEGKRRFVEGVGFAIIRDAGDFLAHAAADATGTPNPLAGRISRALASGKSQDGRFLKTFLLHGFNQAEGRRVFDGMHVFVSGAGLLPILRSGTGPGSSADGAPSFAQPEFPGVHDGPLTIGEIVAKAEARGEVPPKMLLINTQVDYYSIRASLGRTGARGTADLPLPANVRMYDVAGAAHATVPRAEGCSLPPGRLDWAPVARATLLHLDRWVTGNVAPPPTTLMPLEPAPEDPTVLQAPKALPEAVVQVPRRDADGNAVGGIRLPDIAVPLGVHGAQNQPPSFSCSLVGTYLAFPQGRAPGSPGPASLAERYRDNADYVNRIRTAAAAAVQEGFLLPEDAAVIVNDAAASPIFARAPAGPPR
ncbi:alpha/beta hydrolase domain-containing protein [Paracraurococcus lichenis]|uniref:Alpha/beta hydrolase domain-containing protein n=1 Tax=Paracraurococcus lichenis TaxID=3064888 RepID=A0ABT9E9A5_9PROT|nr:alpha/beta hydrolase domain-containing protein [Paracraurococcus sp. LOR1-02]MDO9712741.1 alpha/beta hydrolase domain-containing protein [Paracraurococcus sp. LOR1-02]